MRNHGGPFGIGSSRAPGSRLPGSSPPSACSTWCCSGTSGDGCFIPWEWSGAIRSQGPVVLYSLVGHVVLFLCISIDRIRPNQIKGQQTVSWAISPQSWLTRPVVRALCFTCSSDMALRRALPHSVWAQPVHQQLTLGGFCAAQKSRQSQHADTAEAEVPIRDSISSIVYIYTNPCYGRHGFSSSCKCTGTIHYTYTSVQTEAVC